MTTYSAYTITICEGVCSSSHSQVESEVLNGSSQQTVARKLLAAAQMGESAASLVARTLSPDFEP
jgi:hypothetical protein